MATSWGAYIHEQHLSLHWGGRRRLFDLNPFRYKHCDRYTMDVYGEWDSTDRWTDEGKEIEWYTETHPYRIHSEPHYNASHITGPGYSDVEAWDAIATCYVEKRVRRRRLVPRYRRTDYSVYFDLSDEVGNGKGSWKGGTVGFSETLLPGDSIEIVVGKAARKNRGR